MLWLSGINICVRNERRKTRRFFVITILLVAVFPWLGGCVSASVPSSVMTLEEALEAGFIAFLPVEAEEVQELAIAELRDLYHDIQVRGTIAFRRIDYLVFSRTGGYLQLMVEVGDRVKEDDVLAVLTFEDEEYIMSRRLQEIRLEQFDREAAENLGDLEMELERLMRELESARPEELEAASIAVQLAEVDIAIFRQRTGGSRQPIADLLEDMNDRIAGDEIRAIYDGVVTRTMRDGMFITDRPQVITLVDDSGVSVYIHPWNAQAMNPLPQSVPRRSLLRFGDVITLESELQRENEDGEMVPIMTFDVRVANDPWATGSVANEIFYGFPVDLDAFYQAMEEVGHDLISLRQVTFVGYVPMRFGTGSVVVPRDAVRFGDGINYVFEMVDGIPRRRNVIDGQTREGYTQIISGLEPGSQVVVFR